MILSPEELDEIRDHGNELADKDWLVARGVQLIEAGRSYSGWLQAPPLYFEPHGRLPNTYTLIVGSRLGECLLTVSMQATKRQSLLAMALFEIPRKSNDPEQPAATA